MMISKEQIKVEIDNIKDEHLVILYRIIKDLDKDRCHISPLDTILLIKYAVWGSLQKMEILPNKALKLSGRLFAT